MYVEQHQNDWVQQFPLKGIVDSTAYKDISDNGAHIQPCGKSWRKAFFSALAWLRLWAQSQLYKGMLW